MGSQRFNKMRKKKKTNKFIEYIKEKKHNRKFKPPKFKVGDIIQNKVYKIVTEIKNIRFESISTDYSGRERTDYSSAVYVMLDLENKHKKPGNKIYTRANFVHRIDSTYKKINPEVAQLLYGNSKRDKNESTNKKS